MRILRQTVKERKYVGSIGVSSLSLNLKNDEVYDAITKIKHEVPVTEYELSLFLTKFLLLLEYSDIDMIRIKGMYAQIVLGHYDEKIIPNKIMGIFDTLGFDEFDYDICIENSEFFKYISIDINLKEFEKIGIEIDNNGYNSYLVKTRV